MVAVLTAVPTPGVSAVDAAGAQAMPEGVDSSDVVIHVLTPASGSPIHTATLGPAALKSGYTPVPGCAR